MMTKKLFMGFILSPLVTSVVISAFAVSAVMMASHATFRDVSDGVDRLIIFSTVLSYGMAIVVGIPLYILSIRRQWHKLWRYTLAGFSAGFGLGVISVLTITQFSSLKWQDSYSPFIVIFFFGLAGSAMMTTLWPFIDHNKSIQLADRVEHS
jgi:hypothetical protein